MMATPERPQTFERFGYTARQAQFLEIVARHGGYFLRRQYVLFTRRAHGLATVRFLRHALAQGHVRALPYARHGHVFHLHARPLYAAIGEEHHRNRRSVEWEAMVRKLMGLDFVLAHPAVTFWASESEKSALLTEMHVPQSLWPSRQYESTHPNRAVTVRYFVDKMPWYHVPNDPRLWFAYVDAESTLAGFQTFLVQYREVLNAVSSGVTYVAPTASCGTIQSVFDRVLASGPPSIFTGPTLRAYFQLRQKVDAQQFEALTVADLARFRDLRARLNGDGVDDFYMRWQRAGDESIQRAEVDRLSPLPCVLQIHSLEHRYDLIVDIAKG